MLQAPKTKTVVIMLVCIVTHQISCIGFDKSAPEHTLYNTGNSLAAGH